MTRLSRWCLRSVAPLAVAVSVVAGAGVAVAVSGGGYSPSNQGCSNAADANAKKGGERDCHNMQVLVRDGSGHTYAEAGTYQEAQGDNPHRVGLAVSPTGGVTPSGRTDKGGMSGSIDTNYQPFAPGSCGLLDMLLTPIYVLEGNAPCTDFRPQTPSGAPTLTLRAPSGLGSGRAPDLSGGSVYFGADDNLDSGEHDAPDGRHGSKPAQDGPSDGGAITLSWHPLAATNYSTDLAALMTGNTAPLATDPFTLASLSSGACADGICLEVTTVRQTVYHGGGGAGRSRNVYDYRHKQWDPYNCSSGSPHDEKSCGKAGEKKWRKKEAKSVYAEPGVQIYEDPDPNGSPALPAGQFYPLTAAYVGTCGVTIGGGGFTAPNSPFTNNSGQVAWHPTGC